MGHNKLSEKLDRIQQSELGAAFDEGLIWEKLEQRLAPVPPRPDYRWLVAASLFLAVLLVPLTLRKENSQELHLVIDKEVTIGIQHAENEVETEVPELVVARGSMIRVEGKSTKPELALVSVPEVPPIRIVSDQYKRPEPQFAPEDIAVIRASLERATINEQRLENGRKMSIRAQLQPLSSRKLYVERNKQTLKIKLHEK